MSFDHVSASPLTWPQGWKRTKTPVRSRFGSYWKGVSIAKAIDFVIDELRKMSIPDYEIIVSTDLQLRLDGLPRSGQIEPDDKGVSVWWRDGKDERVIALDQYDRIGDNLWAIGKTIEAMRGIERWGGGEILNRTFTGFAALPGPDSINAKTWCDVLGYQGNDLIEAKQQYKRAARLNHPDRGGNSESFNEVTKAWEQAKLELATKDGG